MNRAAQGIVNASAPRLYFLSAALGSVYGLGDGTGMVAGVQARYAYDVYGAREQVGGAGSTKWGFTGRVGDGTGLGYSRERYLAFSIGQWLSADPMGFVDGPGRQNYVRSRPTRFIDPSGMFSLGSIGDLEIVSLKGPNGQLVEFVLESPYSAHYTDPHSGVRLPVLDKVAGAVNLAEMALSNPKCRQVISHIAGCSDRRALDAIDNSTVYFAARPAVLAPAYGAALRDRRIIYLTDRAMSRGKIENAVTVIHEAAHIAGAEGFDNHSRIWNPQIRAACAWPYLAAAALVEEGLL